MSVVKSFRLYKTELPLTFQHAFTKVASLGGLPTPTFKNWAASASIPVTTSTPAIITSTGFDRASRFISGIPSQGYIAGIRFWSVEEGSTWYGIQWDSVESTLCSHNTDSPTEASKTALLKFPYLSGFGGSSIWFMPFKQDGLNYLCVAQVGFNFGLGAYIVPFPKNVGNGKEKTLITTEAPRAFRYNNTTNVTYSNLNVYDLPDRIDYLTFDPGESPLTALSRATDGLDINWFSRRDGSFSVYRSRDKTGEPSSWAPDSVIGDTEFGKDNRSLISHIRVVGAYAEADVIDYDNLGVVGHVYAEVNNPYIMTDEDARNEANRLIRKNKQDARTLSFTTDHNPLLEPDDKISYSDLGGILSGWLVSSVSITTEAGKPFFQFTCRRA